MTANDGMTGATTAGTQTPWPEPKAKPTGAGVYDRAFFDAQAPGSAASAAAIVPAVHGLLAPRSVIDIGCGVGAWLAEFERLGVAEVLGIDGGYVDRDQLAIDRARFVAHDLERPLPVVARRFDLALCLEVAEHLSPERGPGLVAELALFSDVVLFSAAIPGQGGEHHVNERWPSVWAGLFAEHGLAAFDPFRGLFWADQRVAWWYRQNLLLFARPGVLATAPGGAALRAVERRESLDVVHPERVAWLVRDVERERAALTGEVERAQREAGETRALADRRAAADGERMAQQRSQLAELAFACDLHVQRGAESQAELAAARLGREQAEAARTAAEREATRLVESAQAEIAEARAALEVARAERRAADDRVAGLLGACDEHLARTHELAEHLAQAEAARDSARGEADRLAAENHALRGKVTELLFACDLYLQRVNDPQHASRVIRSSLLRRSFDRCRTVVLRLPGARVVLRPIYNRLKRLVKAVMGSRGRR